MRKLTGEIMTTRLEKFKQRMDPAKELCTRELRDFTQRYDDLGEMTLIEEPDIDTQEYIYSFEKLNGASQEDLDEIFLEICSHMKRFSKSNGIDDFWQNVRIWI